MDQTVFDTLLDAVVLLDEQRKILYANDVFMSLCDLTVRKVKAGVRCFDVIRFDDPELFCMPEGALGKKEPSQYRETGFESSSGKSGKVQVTIQPGERGRWIVYMRDVSLEATLHSKYRAELAMKENALSELQKAHASLENYSKNLEKMVEDRTIELRSANQTLSGMIDSLGQGFLIFTREGRCLSVYSKACERIFLQAPANRSIEELLSLGADEKKKFSTWREALFEENIPFDDLIPLGPRFFSHPQGRRITLEYAPLRGEDNEVEGVILVATDVTREHEATLAAQAERAHVELILKLVKNKNEFVAFVKEALQALDRIEPFLSEAGLRKLDVDEALRSFHTIKGGAGAFQATEVAKAAHELEGMLGGLKERSKAAKKRVGARDIKESFDAVREGLLDFFKRNKEVIGRELDDCERRAEIPARELGRFLGELKSVAGSERLQALFADSFIRQPISEQLAYAADFVRKLAEDQGKLLRPVRVLGGDIRVDPERYQELLQSLVHAFRNAVDHGLEPPEERESQGKAPEALVAVQCLRRGDGSDPRLEIRIVDDGRGIDPGKIRAKLGRRSKSESDEAVIQHVFDSGLSTREQASEISGRGVGMDAIRAAARKLGGDARVKSSLGKGTVLSIEVPL